MLKEQVAPNGEICLAKACSINQRNALGNGQAVGRIDCYIFRVATAIGQGTDSVTRGPVGHPVRSGNNLAGDFQAQKVRGAFGGWVMSAPLYQVRAVYPCGSDLYQHFTGLNFGHRSAAGFQYLGSTGVPHFNCLHALWQFFGSLLKIFW